MKNKTDNVMIPLSAFIKAGLTEKEVDYYIKKAIKDGYIKSAKLVYAASKKHE